MNPEQIQEILNYLMSTGELLATEAYRIALQQVMAESALCTVLWVVFAVLFVIGVSIMVWGLVDSDDDKQISGFLCSAAALVAWIITFTDAYMYKANPEWYAIEKLIELVN